MPTAIRTAEIASDDIPDEVGLDARPPRPALPDPPHDLSESTTQDFTFGELLDVLGGAAALRDVRLGYGATAGAPALRALIAAKCGVPAEAVLTSQGTMLGLAMVAAALDVCGEEVLLVSPCFAPTASLVRRAEEAPGRVALRFEHGYRLDAAAVAQALRPDTRLVCLASPQNPSGIRVPPPVLRAILDAMAARAPDALLLVDETYRDATYGEAAPASAAALDPRVITVSSLSKAHGVPGLRIGWLTVLDPALRTRLTAAKADMVIAGSTLDEAIAVALLEREDAVLAPRRRLLARALEIVAGWRAAEGDRLEWVRPEAGALCCLRLNAAAFDDAAVERFWALLPRHGLRLAPGTWFGEERRVFRLGFGHVPQSELLRALAALSSSIAEAAG